MTCERCNGLMVSEQIYDLQGTNGDLCVDGYRCLLCGTLVDAVILENRQRSSGIAAANQVTSPWVRPLVPA
jgi:hypothetical protein